MKPKDRPRGAGRGGFDLTDVLTLGLTLLIVGVLLVGSGVF